MDERQSQELEEERIYKILLALDECRTRGVSEESLKTLIFETGASSLIRRKDARET